MMTRSEYMADSNLLHDAYYTQFVSVEVQSYVLDAIGEERIMSSVDPHFNDIPLHTWDNLSMTIRLLTSAARKEAGEGNSLSSCVCIAKAAARKIRNG